MSRFMFSYIGSLLGVDLLSSSLSLKRKNISHIFSADLLLIEFWSGILLLFHFAQSGSLTSAGKLVYSLYLALRDQLSNTFCINNCWLSLVNNSYLVSVRVKCLNFCSIPSRFPATSLNFFLRPFDGQRCTGFWNLIIRVWYLKSTDVTL